MYKKSMYCLILIASLLGSVSLSAKIQKVNAPYLVITIEADGSIFPPLANITTSDKVTYTFTADNNASIIVQRSNIVIEGSGWTLGGLDGIWEGFNLTSVSNVTIVDVNIEHFLSYSIYLNYASECVISGNTVSGSEGGIGLFSSTGNTVLGNIVTNCSEAIELASSAGNNISANIMSDCNTGVRAFNSTGNLISGNTVTASTQGIVLVGSSDSNTITRNNMTEYMGGVLVQYSSGNAVSENHITGLSMGGGVGVEVSHSDNNLVSKNYATNHWSGVSLYSSFDNTIAENNLPSNYYGIHVRSSSSNNTVSNNSITETRNIWDDGSGVYLVSSSNNTIEGNDLASNDYGVYVTNSSGSLISRNRITASGYSGVNLVNSTNNTVWRNDITNNSLDSQGFSGIKLDMSSNNLLSENNVTANTWWGINPSESHNNSIIGNNVIDNDVGLNFASSANNTVSGNNITGSVTAGIYLEESSDNNTFYHNNFDYNTNHAIVDPSTPNTWDNGFEGNYWSNYTGTDANYDGVGDSPHVLDSDNADHAPLMGPFLSFNTSRGCAVDVISNSTISGFEYFESNSTIRMYVSNMTSNQTFGFCRVRIPYTLINETAPITVLVNGTDPFYWNYTLHDDGKSRWIYFVIEHSTLEVIVIPEFPSFLILLLFGITTLLGVIVSRRKELRMT